MNMTYDEQTALRVLRRAIVRKPELAAELIKDLTKESAYHLLLQVQRELNMLHKLAEVMATAAAELAKQDKA
jgi:hypothetical protein